MDRRGSEPIIEPSILLRENNYAQELLGRLNSLRSQAGFTDAILCVEHEEFPCHRNVLAVSSPYFNAMFSCDLREKNQPRVVLNQVSPWIMKRIIEYVYSGELEINTDNAQELLAAASLFQYPRVVQACCDFLMKHLHCSNCLGIENFAHMHSCDRLSEDARKFAIENFSAVIRQEEFLELSFDRILFYVRSDLIDVRTEEDVFEAVVEWTDHDIDNRRDKFMKLLEHVRLQTVKLEYLENEVAKNALVKCSDRCMDMVEDAKTFHESKLADSGSCNRRRSLETLPRPSTVAKETLVVVGGGTRSVEMYEAHKNKWMYLAESNFLHTLYYSIASHQNAIYVTGGITDGQIVSTVNKFDAACKLWSDVTDMLAPRAQHTSSSLGSKLYILGGITLKGNEIRPVEDIDAYDSATKQWTRAGHCPYPRKLATLVPYNNSLIELGGTQRDIKVRTIESYHQLTDGTVRYSGEQFVLPEAIQHAQILLVQAVFYIIWLDTKKMISFNPVKRIFRCLPDLPHSHLNGSASVVSGKIYVAGGCLSSDNRASRLVEVFDPTTEVWTQCKSMKQPRSGLGAVTLRL